MAERLILFAHGAGVGSDHPWMDKWAKLLDPLGRVVRFDYPFARKNKGQGQGRHRPDPLEALVQAHRDAIEDSKEAGEKVVLIGKSLGSRVGCHVSLEDGVDVAGIVCLGYPLQAQSGRTRDDVLRSLRSPVMFVQGTRDRMCPIRSLDAIRQDLEVPNYIHLVEGGDHSLIARKTQLDELGKKQEDLDHAAANAIKAFLDKHVPV